MEVAPATPMDPDTAHRLAWAAEHGGQALPGPVAERVGQTLVAVAGVETQQDYLPTAA